MSKKLNKSSTTSKEKNNCCDTRDHPDHSYLLPNVNRVTGQMEGIKKMIAERRYCPEILQQLKSIKSVICGIESSILEAHINACVTDAFNSQNEKEKAKKIAELKVLYRRFN